MLDQEIAEFGRRMGLPSLSLDERGLVALDVEHMGRLHLERAESAPAPCGGAGDGPALLVYLAAPCPPHDKDAPARVLELCHYRHGHPMPLTGGVHRDRYVLLTRLTERETTAASLENATKFLAAMLEKVAG